jgi:hypothetical protein
MDGLIFSESVQVAIMAVMTLMADRKKYGFCEEGEMFDKITSESCDPPGVPGAEAMRFDFFSGQKAMAVVRVERKNKNYSWKLESIGYYEKCTVNTLTVFVARCAPRNIFL